MSPTVSPSATVMEAQYSGSPEMAFLLPVDRVDQHTSPTSHQLLAAELLGDDAHRLMQ